MLEQNFWILGLVLKILAGLFALLAALFTFLSALQNKKHEKTRLWYQLKWKKINHSKWLRMPEVIVKVIVSFKENLHMRILLVAKKDFAIYFLFFDVLILFIYGIVVLYLNVNYLLVSLLILVVFIISVYIVKASSVSYILFLLFTVDSLIWIFIVLETHLIYSTLAMFFLIPCFVFLLSSPLVLFGYIFRVKAQMGIKTATALALLGFSIGISFFVTFLSFLVGSLISSQSYIPQTFQMLMSNVILDGITMLFTFKILGWSIAKKPWARIPLAVLLDIMVAAILACLSLYLGLLFSEHQLSLKEVLFVLIGRSVSGEDIELGPYFWAMHTTFIPTCLYLMFIIVAWLGKSTLLPVRWFFGKGHEHQNPLALTATLFALIATIFGVIGYATDGIEKHNDKEQKKAKIANYVSHKPATKIYFLNKVGVNCNHISPGYG